MLNTAISALSPATLRNKPPALRNGKSLRSLHLIHKLYALKAPFRDRNPLFNRPVRLYVVGFDRPARVLASDCNYNLERGKLIVPKNQSSVYLTSRPFLPVVVEAIRKLDLALSIGAAFRQDGVPRLSRMKQLNISNRWMEMLKFTLLSNFYSAYIFRSLFFKPMPPQESTPPSDKAVAAFE